MIRRATFFEVRFLSFRPEGGRRIDFEVESSRGAERKGLSWTVPEGLSWIFDDLQASGEPSDEEIARNLHPLLDPRTRDLSGPAPESQEELGRQLYAAFFSGEAASLFFGDVYHDEEGLALLFSFDLTDPVHLRLYGLPWERLHDGKEFLQLNGRPIVRRLVTGGPVTALESPSRGPLRILAAPVQAEDLDIPAEIASLKKVETQARAGSVKLTLLEKPPKLAKLKRRLGKDTFHVLHVMGHGRRDHEADAWGLDFADGFASSSEVARHLGSNVLRRLRLIVVNTCHGGRADSSDREAVSTWDLGLAVGLVEKGARAVIANQGPISDAAAVELSAGFYDRVAAGEHPVPALQSTRGDIKRLKSGLPESDWSMPVHLVASKDPLPIFEPPAESPPKDPPGKPPPFPRVGLIALLLVTAAGLGLGSMIVALLGHLASLQIWQIAATAVIPTVAAAILSFCAWLGRHRDEPAWAATLGCLGAHASVVVPLCGVVLLGTGLFWGTVGTRRVAEIPCRRLSTPGEPVGGWVGYRFPGTDEVQHQARDLLRGPDTSLRWVLLDSPKGRAFEAEACLDFTVVGRELETVSGPSVQVAVRRRGDPEPRTVQEPGDWASSRRSVLYPARALLGLEASTPTDPGTEIRRRLIEGFQLYEAGKLEEAHALWSTAVTLDGDYAPLRQGLANVSLDLARRKILRPDGAAVSYSAAQDAEELLRAAEEHLKWALRLAEETADPERAAYAFDLARVHRRQALLLSSTPDGDAGAVEARFDQARQALEQAVRWDPSSPRALNNLAALLLDRDPTLATRALELLRQAWVHIAEDDHTRAAVLKNQARALMASGELEPALEALQLAACTVPESSSSLRADILGLEAQLVGRRLGPATARVAWWRYGSIAGRDEAADPARRRAFALSELDRLSAGGVGEWPASGEAVWRRRCLVSGPISNEFERF